MPQQRPAAKVAISGRAVVSKMREWGIMIEGVLQ